jgi:hypothetical protein
MIESYVSLGKLIRLIVLPYYQYFICYTNFTFYLATKEPTSSKHFITHFLLKLNLLLLFLALSLHSIFNSMSQISLSLISVKVL